MGFGTAQCTAGQQIAQRTIVENAQDVPPLAEGTPQMRNQHLPHSRFVANQLHQLIDTILLQQVLCSLLLKRQPGVEECQTRAFTAPDFRFPRQPAAILHGVEQGAHMTTRAAQ